jgi:hypothetical protein
MLEYINNNNPTGLFIILAALCGAFVTIYVRRKNAFTTAADKFRGVVLNELQGLIPINGFWKPDEYIRFSNGVPIIKKAAMEFRPHIPFYSKTGFDKAVLDYCEKAEKANFNTAILDAVEDNSIKITQKEAMSICVHHLLSFAE